MPRLQPKKTRRKTPPKRETVAVIGYGSQGRALALNLDDSGRRVLIGLRSRSRSRRTARADGFNDIRHIAGAVSAATIVIIAIPDHVQGDVFRSDIAPALQKHTLLVFLHGLAVHFELVTPQKDCDVALLAPHAPGSAVRERYLSHQRDISAFYAIARNATRSASARLFALAKAVGFDRKRLLKTTFKEEAIGDIFGEQAVLCGGLAMLIKYGFETLVANGHKPEHAYLEVAYQLDLIIDLVKRFGIEGMLRRISVTARVGSVEAGPKVVGAGSARAMARVYKDIASGKFVRALSRLSDDEMAELNNKLAELSNRRLEKAARKFS